VKARIFNEMAETGGFTDKQLISFLNTCFSNTPTFQVLTVFNNAAKAAGNIKYHANLLNMLHDSLNRLVLDSANTSTRNPRVTRSVNVSELQFDDNEPNSSAYETHVHDIAMTLTRRSMTL
jgi:hypothetical protein